ncbi:MAG: ATP-binding cassette domain-containing protein, partial [Myxococcota bacterium]
GRIGYMSQNFSLYADLNAEENILFFADLFNMKGKDKRERFQEVVEALNLKNYLKVLTGDLPLGIKQRIALASATIHKPSILFLDEPTSGVDPISRREFFYYIMNFIKRYKATVVLSTHFLNEAEYCNMIFFFNKGKIILDGRPADILNNFEYNIFEIARFKESEKLLNILKDDISVVESYIYGKKIRIIAKKEVKREHIAALLNIGENHINITKPSLDDVFIRSTNV